MNKVEHAILECETHLKNTDSFGTEVEAYLTRYLLLLISAHFEENLEEAFIIRAAASGDSFVSEYFKNDIPNQLKSVGITKLNNFIKKFGIDYSNKFKEKIIDELDREVTAYGNIIKNRHLVAHETTEPQITFYELVGAYNDSKKIIDKIKEILM